MPDATAAGVRHRQYDAHIHWLTDSRAGCMAAARSSSLQLRTSPTRAKDDMMLMRCGGKINRRNMCDGHISPKHLGCMASKHSHDEDEEEQGPPIPGPADLQEDDDGEISSVALIAVCTGREIVYLETAHH
jgi:hypothetical protein